MAETRQVFLKIILESKKKVEKICCGFAKKKCEQNIFVSNGKFQHFRENSKY